MGLGGGVGEGRRNGTVEGVSLKEFELGSLTGNHMSVEPPRVALL